MALSSIEQQQFGLKKEAVRGTGETTPTKWYPVEKDTSMEYSLKLIKDQALRGTVEEFPQVAGVKEGKGKVKFPMDPQMMGEFLNSLLGSVSSVQQAATIAYQHTFLKSNSLQHQAYTFFMDRGLDVQAYSLGTVKKMIITGSVDGLIMVENDVLFKGESTQGIGSPAYPTQHYQAFNNVNFKIGGASNTDVKNWQIHIDNNAQVHRTMSQSQDVSDILCRHKLIAGGSFTIFFQNETERAKFLANTVQSLEVVMTGGLIASTYAYLLDILFPQIHYTAYPYHDVDGLLGANVQFEAVYDATATKVLSILLNNTDTAY
jgi:hypothetical protein